MALNLVIAAIVYWNTLYMDKATEHLRKIGKLPDPSLRKHVSPLGWEHINMLFLHLPLIKKVVVEALGIMYISVFYRIYCHSVTTTFFLNPSNRRSWYDHPNNYLQMQAK